MNETVDVVVVGAGPIGLTTALLLADQGVSVTLLERNAALTDEPRAISITDESLRVMGQLGILQALEPEMLMGTGARYFGRNNQLLAHVEARPSPLGYPAKSQFDQPILVELLFAATRQRDRLTVCFSSEVQQVHTDDDGVLVRVAGPDGDAAVRAQWLVACDGGRSPIRSQLGVALEGSTQVEKWIVVDIVNAKAPPTPYSRFYCNGARPCVVVPGVKGRCRYEFMLLPGEADDAVTSPAFITELLAPYQAIEPGDIRRAAVYMAQQRVAARYRHGRILLAGDAAHLMPPFAGQGLNAGIRDAANLAWKLAAHVQGRGTEALVDSYEQERRPHVVEMVRLSHRIGQVVMSTSRWACWLRDSGIAALGGLPVAKRWLVEMRFLKQPHLTRGCVVAPGAAVPPAARQLVGRALPQPPADAPGGRLHELLGPGWSLLRFPPDGSIHAVAMGPGTSSPEARACNALASVLGELVGKDVRLVVRPDRYVAAACLAHDQTEVLNALSRYSTALDVTLAPPLAT